jgi:hypothetical protein
MKRMNFGLVACVIAALAICDSTYAQQGTTTGWMMYTDTIGRSLELTPEQEELVRDWDARYQREYDRLAPDGLEQDDLAPLERRRNNELRGILTPDQYARWNEMDIDRERRSTHTTGGAPGPEMRRGAPPASQPGVIDQSRGSHTGRDRGTGVQQAPGTGTNIDRGLGTDGGTGTTGTGSATDGGNRNTVTPPTP